MGRCGGGTCQQRSYERQALDQRDKDTEDTSGHFDADRGQHRRRPKREPQPGEKN
jgi:hypothetical protein